MGAYGENTVAQDLNMGFVVMVRITAKAGEADAVAARPSCRIVHQTTRHNFSSTSFTKTRPGGMRTMRQRIFLQPWMISCPKQRIESVYHSRLSSRRAATWN